MQKQSNLPIGIGPHEGKKLELMLSGEKRLAMFSDVVPASFDWGEDQFDRHVKLGTLIKREKTLERGNINFRFVYFSLPDEENRIDELHQIQLEIFTGMRQSGEKDDIQIGKLLDYTDEEINVFINWTRQLKDKENL